MEVKWGKQRQMGPFQDEVEPALLYHCHKPPPSVMGDLPEKLVPRVIELHLHLAQELQKLNED